MNHIAEMVEQDSAPRIKVYAALLAPAMCLPVEVTKTRLNAMLRKHADEWRQYVDSLGEQSFVKQWA